MVHLAAAIAKIGEYTAPVHLTSITRRYFEGLSTLEPEDIGKWMRVLDTPDRGEHAQRVLSDANPLWNSMMRDSIAPTMLQAGVRVQCHPLGSPGKSQYTFAAGRYGQRPDGRAH